MGIHKGNFPGVFDAVGVDFQEEFVNFVGDLHFKLSGCEANLLVRKSVRIERCCGGGH